MSERWRGELRKIDELEPPADVLDDARSRPASSPPGPSVRSRIFAGVAAFVLFGAAVAWMAGAFGRSTPIAGDTQAPAPPASPSVSFTFEANRHPAATMSVDGSSHDGQPLSYSWQENGSIGFYDTVAPDLSAAARVDVSAGAPIVIEGNADGVRGWVDSCCDLSMPPPHLYELELNRSPTMPTDSGPYVLEFAARWPQGGVTFLFPIQVVSAETPTQSPIPSGGPTTYSDPMGWSMELPAGWTASHHSFEVNEGATISGEVSGTPFGITIDHFSPGYVVTPGGMTYPHDDTQLPLDPKKLETSEGGPSMWFMEGGVSFRIQVESRLTLDPDAQSVVDDMIRSIAFEPWPQAPPADSLVRNGWRSLYLFSGDPSAMQDAGVSWQCWSADTCYVAFYGTEMPLVLGPIPICGEGENMTADRSSAYPIVLQCPDGTTQAWSGSGDPAPTNVAPYATPLDQHPTIRAWDGTYLTNTKLGNG